MNPSTPAASEGASLGSYDDGLDNLESRLWERARRNLRLLYNGGAFVAPAGQSANPSCPLTVAHSKI